MTFAVIKTGGKQYKVKKGDIISIEILEGDYKEGDKITFNDVLLIADDTNTEIGTPKLDKRVEAKFLESYKGKKIRIQKFKSKSNYDKVTGHRQNYFKVQITKI